MCGVGEGLSYEEVFGVRGVEGGRGKDYWEFREL